MGDWFPKTSHKRLPRLQGQNRPAEKEEVGKRSYRYKIIKKLAASSMLHEAKIAYYAFDVIVYCMYTHQTRIVYTKRTH